MAWIYFVGLTVLMYVAINFIGKISGGESTSALEAAKAIFSPTVFLLVVGANVLFAISIFYGFSVSSSALAISVAIGVLTAFVFSVVTLGVSVTLTKVLGLVLVVAGIYLLK